MTRRRGPLLVSGLALAVVGAGAGRWWRGSATPRPAAQERVGVQLQTAAARSLEVRLAYPAADRHRPYSVARGAADQAHRPAPGDDIALATLAELERRGDLHGVAAGYVLLGEPRRAAAYLSRAGDAPDVAADRAALALVAGRPEDALIALDGVLAVAARHPQALWNRALALRDLGLARMAIEAFEAVGALDEPGWAVEARARAGALRVETDGRKAASDQVLAAGPRLATAPDGISPALARRVPGLSRLYFYDAMRGAPTAAAVRALAPLARALDEVAGGEVLARYLERVARSDFHQRGPLAARYARIVGGERLAPGDAASYLAALRAAHLDDLLLGALILTAPDGKTVPPDRLEEYRALAAATGDPWFELLAVEQGAGAVAARRDAAIAERLEPMVLTALAGCEAGALEYRCARLELLLAEHYLAMQRLSDARRVIRRGVARARRDGAWALEQRFLPQLADLEVLSDDVAAGTLPLVRAYTDELMRRDARCTTAIWSRERVAMMHVNRVELEAARAALAQADALGPGCPEARPILAGIYAEVCAAGDDQVEALRGKIAQLRAQTRAPGELAALDQSEGRLLIGRDRARGIALLGAAIARARALFTSDVDAHKARTYAYTSLMLDAGQAHDWDRVWQLLEEEAGAAVPRCGLGLAVEGRRGVVVARDHAGTALGHHEVGRTSVELAAASLVPEDLRRHLRGCEEVDVVARSPVEGSPALLPIEIAWGYKTARSSAAASDGAAPARRRLVVSDAEPPASLDLPRLRPWRSNSPPDAALVGPNATPTRVLAALADAGYVEIHAHGIVNPAVSDAALVMLSPDPDGRFALTAAAIRAQALRGHPVVLLAACHAGAAASYRHQSWGLPAAFVGAGARAVIASPEVIADADAGEVFDELRARIERGASPAVALRDVRTSWLSTHPGAAWVRSLMVFH